MHALRLCDDCAMTSDAALLQDFNIGPDQIDALFHYAKFQFECGNYSAASEFLYHYRTLSTDPDRNMSALWGKLAATVLQQVSCLSMHIMFSFVIERAVSSDIMPGRLHVVTFAGEPAFIRSAVGCWLCWQ